MTRRIMIVLLVLSLVFVVSCSSGKDDNIPIPNYETWITCFGENTRTCFDNNNLSLAMNVVTEYVNRNTREKALLVWWQNERSRDKFEIHNSVKSHQIQKIVYRFYKRENEGWYLLETRDFVRSKSPKNIAFTIFDKDSSFGKEYLKFKRKVGDKENEIEIPTMTFVE